MVQGLLTFPLITYFTDCNPFREPYTLLKKCGFVDLKFKIVQ